MAPAAAHRRGGALRLLAQLERIRTRYDAGSATEKRVRIEQLERARFARAADVLRLHEALLFLSAFPDDRAVLAAVTRALGRFGARADVRRLEAKLVDTGIAGTDIRYPFFWYTARWLAARWPRALVIDWDEFDRKDQLEALLPHLLPYCETLTLDQLTYAPRQWIRILKSRDETDATFLIRRFEGLDAGSFGREAEYDRLGMPIVLRAGKDTPNRSTARRPGARIVFQSRPLHEARPDLRRALHEPVVSVRDVSPREGERLLSLTREAMVTRARDLDAFEKADVCDVRRIDCGEGLEFACFGVVPQRRLMLESVYGFLTMKNGVPIGYVLASALFGSSEVAYNVFETWRGAESAHVYGRVLAMVRTLFGSTSFAVDPYQLGHDNEEGQQSGAWWFYYKLGFRPTDRATLALVRRELARIRNHPRHRSSPRTVHRLAKSFMFLHAGRGRKDVLGAIALENVGLKVSRALAARYGADRERALEETSLEARRLIGATDLRGWTRDQQRAGQRWSPLIVSLPGITRWSPSERRALGPILKAKGGRRESDFVALFDRHVKLRRAILELSQSPK